MKKADEQILIKFCLHESLNFPKTKELFLQQNRETRKLHLKEMKKVISLTPPKNHLMPKDEKSRLDE